MSSLVRKFLLFLVALGILFGSAFIAFRCGYKKGLGDAPRHYYSLDVSRALTENPAFRRYVDSLYVTTYRSVMDSVIRTDKMMTLVGKWLDAHPDCAMSVNKPVPNVGRQEFENTFFMKH